MAATDNNLRIPNDLLVRAEQLAESQGRSADDVAAEALKRYLTFVGLDELSRYGQQRAREMGLAELSEDEQMDYVVRVIHEHRTGSSQ